jgi:tRNA(fMet)-specific endonuclease VapC
MRYLLDTNTCIRFLNGTSERVRQRMAAMEPRDIALCSIVKAELLYGALKSARPDQNVGRLRPFFNRFVSLPFDDASAEEYGEIRVALEAAGTPIGPNDLFIAAIARTNDLALVTHNTDEFARVEELRLADWE